MGVFRRQDDGRLERVADGWQDTMAFTVVGPGHFIASGHPDLREDLPPQLGLIESTDAAETWRSLPLQWRADFHALDVSSDLIYGYDSANGALLKTLDGRGWQVIDRGPLADIAADPSDSSRLLATTLQGQLLAYDVPPGTSRRVEGAPPLYLIDWVEGDSVVGVSTVGEPFLTGVAAGGPSPESPENHRPSMPNPTSGISRPLTASTGRPITVGRGRT